MTAYYNDNDPFAAAWLRELIKADLIVQGEVDERSIVDIKPSDLAGFTQCHFFAGIGGWSYALRLAGWPDDRPVWTGSCPCQPFSAAGKGDGFADERHLWPGWFHLISQQKPDVVFGEQVDSAIRHGWLDLVQADLEGIGYAVGAVGLPAAGVGAPHIRQRLWFVADASSRTGERNTGSVLSTQTQVCSKDWPINGNLPVRHQHGGAASELADSDGTRCGTGRPSEASDGRNTPRVESTGLRATNFWSACDRLPCRDGKARPVESGTLPLAHGVSARVGRLRGYGNAIVPQVAAEVIAAYLSCQHT